MHKTAKIDLNSTPARVLPELPIDLLIDRIVPRLPVKSILKLRSVSKEWRVSLSDRLMEKKAMGFARMTHLIFPEKIPGRGEDRAFARCMSVGGACGGASLKWLAACPVSADTTAARTSGDPCMVDVCNGLVLMDVDFKVKKGEFRIFNPVNKTQFVLPPSPSASEKDYGAHSYIVSLDYDPGVSPHFKVVCFLPGADQLKFSMAIFSSDVGDWALSNEIKTSRPLPSNYLALSRKAVFLNGALYVILPNTHLVRFDFAEKTFYEIKLPKSAGEDASSGFGVSLGCLYFALVCEDGQLRIWMLQDFATEKWVLRHTVFAEDLVSKAGGEVPHSLGLLSSSCFHPDKEAIYLMVGSNIFCYELEGGLMNCILQKSTEVPVSSNGRITAYSPCLVNLKWYDLDNVQKKQQVEKQWCFRKVIQN